jgi:hypothetical protein
VEFVNGTGAGFSLSSSIFPPISFQRGSIVLPGG